jgi:hypothetical protein
MASSRGRAVCGFDLRPLPCWDCGFDSRRCHRYLSLVTVVCCQVELSETSWFQSLVQSHPPECDGSVRSRNRNSGAANVPLGLSNRRKIKWMHIEPLEIKLIYNSCKHFFLLIPSFSRQFQEVYLSVRAISSCVMACFFLSRILEKGSHRL